MNSPAFGAESTALKRCQPPRESERRCPPRSDSTTRCPAALIKPSTAMASHTLVPLEDDQWSPKADGKGHKSPSTHSGIASSPLAESERRLPRDCYIRNRKSSDKYNALAMFPCLSSSLIVTDSFPLSDLPTASSGLEEHARTKAQATSRKTRHSPAEWKLELLGTEDLARQKPEGFPRTAGNPAHASSRAHARSGQPLPLETEPSLP